MAIGGDRGGTSDWNWPAAFVSSREGQRVEFRELDAARLFDMETITSGCVAHHA
jgi:hypothetical protein